MNYACVVFVAVIGAALSHYFFPKYGARNWFTYVFIEGGAKRQGTCSDGAGHNYIRDRCGVSDSL